MDGMTVHDDDLEPLRKNILDNDNRLIVVEPKVSEHSDLLNEHQDEINDLDDRMSILEDADSGATVSMFSVPTSDATTVQRIPAGSDNHKLEAIKGTKVKVSTSGHKARALVTGALDMGNAKAGSVFYFVLRVNGQDQGKQIIFGSPGSSFRATASQFWEVPVVRGDHTLELFGARDSGEGTVSVNFPHAGMTVTVFDS
ncbi:hypothetical protein [Sciscionella marina]|uniref:hypothetical protein n=1 Tax=Sciscionella marina TaxID=508770 RepID=UPI0012F684CB|nr:hypothetical protein [Sciscionella marina]